MDPATIMTIIKVAKSAKNKGKAGGSIMDKYGGDAPKLSFGGESQEKAEKPKEDEKT